MISKIMLRKCIKSIASTICKLQICKNDNLRYQQVEHTNSNSISALSSWLQHKVKKIIISANHLKVDESCFNAFKHLCPLCRRVWARVECGATTLADLLHFLLQLLTLVEDQVDSLAHKVTLNNKTTLKANNTTIFKNIMTEKVNLSYSKGLH